MTDKFFVDSNVLIYLFSTTEDEKRVTCRKLVAELNSSNLLVWSTQVIQEYYKIMTQKYRKEPLLVKRSLRFFKNFELVINDLEIINSAIDIHHSYKLSFWDSLIVASSVSARCSYLLTEDLNKGQKIKEIQIVSPFDLDL